jgi:hypothetical protein
MIEWTGHVECDVEGIGTFYLTYTFDNERPWEVLVGDQRLVTFVCYRPSLSDAIGFVEVCKQMGRLPENR